MGDLSKVGAGIYCLEGDWGGGLDDRASVRPILELLEKLDRARTVHRDVATRGEFLHYVGQWRKRANKKYPILYISTHGEPGWLVLREATAAEEQAADSEDYKPDDRAPYVALTDLLEHLEGECSDRIVYFGGCAVLDLDDRTLKELARRTGATAIVGFENDVDWMVSASFEVMLLDHLSHNMENARFFSRIVKQSGKIAEDLGLIVATRARVYRARSVDR